MPLTVDGQDATQLTVHYFLKVLNKGLRHDDGGTVANKGCVFIYYWRDFWAGGM